MKNEDTCPCKSGKPFGECCGPILDGTRKAATAAEGADVDADVTADATAEASAEDADHD